MDEWYSLSGAFVGRLISMQLVSGRQEWLMEQCPLEGRGVCRGKVVAPARAESVYQIMEYYL
jgi:hypothetical protein